MADCHLIKHQYKLGGLKNLEVEATKGTLWFLGLGRYVLS